MNTEYFQDFLKNPERLGLDSKDFIDFEPKQKEDIILGEYFALVAKIAGSLAR